MNRKKDVFRKLIPNILIICLTLFWILILAVGIDETKSTFRTHYADEKEMLYNLKGGYYYQLLNDTYTRENLGIKTKDDDMKAAHASAKYAYAAVRYKAYLEAGDTALADREHQKMQALREDFGEYGFVTDNIYNYLEVK